jgi:hypothetical protein
MSDEITFRVPVCCNVFCHMCPERDPAACEWSVKPWRVTPDAGEAVTNAEVDAFVKTGTGRLCWRGVV